MTAGHIRRVTPARAIEINRAWAYDVTCTVEGTSSSSLKATVFVILWGAKWYISHFFCAPSLQYATVPMPPYLYQARSVRLLIWQIYLASLLKQIYFVELWPLSAGSHFTADIPLALWSNHGKHDLQWTFGIHGPIKSFCQLRCTFDVTRHAHFDWMTAHFVEGIWRSIRNNGSTSLDKIGFAEHQLINLGASGFSDY